MKMIANLLAAGALSLLLGWPCGAGAQGTMPPASDEALLTQLLERFLDGASRGDPEAHRRFWDDDLVYTSSGGERFGKAEILEGLESAGEDEAPAVDYSAEDIRVRVYGDAAVVAFRLVGAPADGSAPSRYFNTGSFVRRADGWRAVAWQATRIPAPD